MRLRYIFESVKANIYYKYMTEFKSVVCLLLDTEKNFAIKLQYLSGAGRNKLPLVSDKPDRCPVGYLIPQSISLLLINDKTI